MDRSLEPLEAAPDSTVHVDFSDRGFQPAVIAIHATFLTLMLVTLGFRLYARTRRPSHLWWDDYLAVLAAIATIIASAFVLSAIPNGYGKHVYDVLYRDYISTEGYSRFYAASGFPSIIANLFIRLSIALFYWRTFRYYGRGFRIATITILSISLTYHLAEIIYSAFQYVTCVDHPIEGDYNTIDNPVCFSNLPYWFFNSLDVASSVYLLFLPIAPVYKHGLTGAKNAGVWILFIVGGLATSASIMVIATPYIVDVAADGGNGYVYWDWLYAEAINDVPWFLEMALGVIAISLPALDRLFDPSTTKSGLSSV